MQRSKDTHLKAYEFIVKNSQQQRVLAEKYSSENYIDQTVKF